MKFILTVYSLFAGIAVFSQKIVNVAQQTVGNKVIITYDISETKPNQVFDVAVYSSHDNFSRALTSVNGNGVGSEVTGGLNRTVIWNVLNDVPQFVGDFNFEVRAIVSDFTSSIKETGSDSRAVTITGKDSAYPEIANTLTNYINEAKDLKDAYQFLTSRAFESREALNSLTDATNQYNNAYQKLNNERLTYEKYVSNFWKHDVLALEFKSLMDYTLGDVHSVDILTLNQHMTAINTIYEGKLKGQKKINEARLELTKNIDQDVVRLDKRLQELERRSNRMLYNLSQD